MADDDRLKRPGWVDHGVAALNAWVGDYLAETDNGLHQPMAFFQDNQAIAPEHLPAPPTGRACVLVHGLGCNEALWSFPAVHPGGSYGDLLQERLGYTPLAVRYNTGLRVSTNGEELAALLERYAAHHGDALTELLLVGHSMGGLVIRSACHLARDGSWTPRVRHIFYLGSPHLGAPLERATNAATHLLGRINTTATHVIRDVVNTRSAGVKDLRYGNLVDEDWLDHDPDALLANTRVAIPWLATARHHRIVGQALPGVGPIGDAVVTSFSASASASGAQPGAPGACDVRVLPGLNHLALARHPDVYAQMALSLADG